ncbi:MAG: hypothetical protein QM734_07730 [Cyclobacteriaceae bacterium]
MKIKSLQRFILVAAGICTVAVILLSHSFYQSADIAKAKSEKAKDKKEVSIHAPSDVTTQSHSVELNEHQPAVVEDISSPKAQNETLVFIEKTTIKFFKTLFRAIISPNAP